MADEKLEALYAKLDELLRRLTEVERSLEELKVSLGFPAKPPPRAGKVVIP
jgi:hypothetical protein